ncbi:hypothetical protein AB0N06_37190, partial [Streptomyces sp. NPDC051020]
ALRGPLPHNGHDATSLTRPANRTNPNRAMPLIVAAAAKSSKLFTGSTLKVYQGAPHGLSMVPKFTDQFNADLLAFTRG